VATGESGSGSARPRLAADFLDDRIGVGNRLAARIEQRRARPPLRHRDEIGFAIAAGSCSPGSGGISPRAAATAISPDASATMATTMRNRLSFSLSEATILRRFSGEANSR
jgi:hypothetical protein